MTDQTRIRIGTAPISWGACEIPKWGEQLPYARVLDEMAACGYEGTELGPWSYLPTDPATLRGELDARKLALAGAFCPVTLHDPDRREASLRTARETIDLLAAAGAPVLVLAEAATSGVPRSPAVFPATARPASATRSGGAFATARTMSRVTRASAGCSPRSIRTPRPTSSGPRRSRD